MTGAITPRRAAGMAAPKIRFASEALTKWLAIDEFRIQSAQPLCDNIK
jgi:hypothetical protein